MVSLLQLKEYAEQTNESNALKIINDYIKTTHESWTKGKYYLGGQLPLELSEIITDEHIKYVENKNNSSGGPCNSWEAASMGKSQYEFNVINTLIKKIKTSNIKKYFNESETEFNILISTERY